MEEEMELEHIKYLVHANSFIFIIQFNSYNQPSVNWIVSPFNRRDLDSERLDKEPKFIWLLNSKATGLTLVPLTLRSLLSSPSTIPAIPRKKEGRRIYRKKINQ